MAGLYWGRGLFSLSLIRASATGQAFSHGVLWIGSLVGRQKMHPWHHFKVAARDVSKALCAPIGLSVADKGRAGETEFLAFVRSGDSAVRTVVSLPLWEKPASVAVDCAALRNSYSIRPTVTVSTPRHLSPSEQSLLTALVENASAAAVKSFRTDLANEIRLRLDEDVRRTSLLTRVLSDKLRVSLAFAHCQLLRELGDTDQAELIFHSDKPDIALDKPQVVRTKGALHAALTQQQHILGQDGQGQRYLALPIAPHKAAVTARRERHLLVLSGPVAFPGDAAGTRAVTFFDHVMAVELANLLKTVLTDFHMQKELSYNYEMAFHGSGRTVDSIGGGLAFLMEALYGFHPDNETTSPPAYTLTPVREGDNTKPIRDVIESNYANALSLANQIHRFELSKPKMHKFILEVVEKPVKECLTPVIRTLPYMDQVHAGGKATRINRLTNSREFPDPVLVDKRALQIVFSNLLENAIKYRKRGAPADITISWVNAEKFVEFTFRDQGLGIRAGEEDSVFHPYFRGTNAKQYGIGGTGLGLTTVRELLKGMGAQISIEPVSDGTAFKVRVARAAQSHSLRHQ